MSAFHFIFAITALALLPASQAAVNIDITPPLANWDSTNPSAQANADYRFKPGDDSVLQYNSNTTNIVYTAEPIDIDRNNELTLNTSITPAYQFVGGQGGFFFLADSGNPNGEYVSVQFVDAGTNLDRLFLQTNASETKEVTLANGLELTGRLNLDVTLENRAPNEWTLNGTIADGSGIIWDSASAGAASIQSDALANESEAYFSSADSTNAGSTEFTEIQGGFSTVPEPAESALVLSVAIGCLVVASRRRAECLISRRLRQ